MTMFDLSDDRLRDLAREDEVREAVRVLLEAYGTRRADTEARRRLKVARSYGKASQEEFWSNVREGLRPATSPLRL